MCKILPWPTTPTTTRPPTAAGSASWKSSPVRRSSPPSIRGTSSSHPASTNKQNSWTMLSLFSFWYRTVELARLRCSCLYPFVYLKRAKSNCLSNKQENHNLLESRNNTQCVQLQMNDNFSCYNNRLTRLKDFF